MYLLTPVNESQSGDIDKSVDYSLLPTLLFAEGENYNNFYFLGLTTRDPNSHSFKKCANYIQACNADSDGTILEKYRQI